MNNSNITRSASELKKEISNIMEEKAKWAYKINKKFPIIFSLSAIVVLISFFFPPIPLIIIIRFICFLILACLSIANIRIIIEEKNRIKKLEKIRKEVESSIKEKEKNINKIITLSSQDYKQN